MEDQVNMIGYDNNDANNGHVKNNRLITEDQAQQVHLIRDNNKKQSKF